MKCGYHCCLNDVLDGKRFCSKKCKNKFGVDLWRKRAKLRAVEYKGGKCQRCGYDKCLRALEFHHRDKKDKLFGISRPDTKSWERIKKELDKCELVCANCHRELEEQELLENTKKCMEEKGLTFIRASEIPVFIRANAYKVPKVKNTVRDRKVYDKICEFCGKSFKTKIEDQKFCSIKCNGQSQKVFDITKEELERLVNEQPFTKIGQMFGVSDKAIKKRCVSLGINIPNRRGYWQKLNASKNGSSSNG